MLGFSNEVTYVVTSINIFGAFATMIVMLWATHNSVPVLRPVYACVGALSTAYCIAHIFILFDIDNPSWIGYLHVLRAISWPIISTIPIVGYKYIQTKVKVIDHLAEQMEKSTPNE